MELGRNLLGIESHCAWASPGTFSVVNVPCGEDGSDCGGIEAHQYVDPSKNIEMIHSRLGKSYSSSE